MFLKGVFKKHLWICSLGVISDLNESSFHNDGSTRKGEALEGLLFRERERARESSREKEMEAIRSEQVWGRWGGGGAVTV